MTTFISPQALSVYEPVAPTGVAAYAWLLILIPLASAGLLLLLGLPRTSGATCWRPSHPGPRSWSAL